MTNFDRDEMLRHGVDPTGARSGNAPALIGAAVVIVLLVGAVWYGFKGADMNSAPPAHQPMTEAPAVPAPQPSPPPKP
jgi:hypothetical protein